MKLVALLLLLASASLFSAPLEPNNFREWLDDAAIEDTRPMRLQATVPFSQVKALLDSLSNADPKAKADTYDFGRQVLTVDTNKGGARLIADRLADFEVSQLFAASDLGTFYESMGKIERIQSSFQAGKISFQDAARDIRAILSSEFNLRKKLSNIDVIALGAGLLDKELMERRPEDMVSKVRDGHATGLRFFNEVDVENNNAPPSDDASYAYVYLQTFPTARGSVRIYRKVAKVADGKEYILAAKLPKEYEYELAPGTTVNNPMFVLKKK